MMWLPDSVKVWWYV